MKRRCVSSQLSLLWPALTLSLIVTCTAMAQTSLDVLIQKLQASTNDNVLREQIIKTAAEMKPAPSIPEAARRAFVQANTIFKEAKDAAGQQLAIAAYKEAIQAAPWWSDPYFNLARTQELAGSFAAARESLGWYIKTKPGDKEEREAQDRIYALEAKEKLSQDNASRAAKLKAEADAKAANEVRKTRILNFFRGSYIALQCGPSGNKYGGCTQEQYGGVNWTRIWNYSAGKEYIFKPKIDEGDGIIEIVAPKGLANLTWGDHGDVSKIVGRYDEYGRMEWTCHYSGSSRKNDAQTARNAFFDDATNTHKEGASIVLTCDSVPWSPLTRYRWLEFRRQ